jgi:hypothetical protein
MLNSLFPGVDFQIGGLAMSVFVAGAALAILVALGIVVFRRAGSMNGALGGGALVLVGALGFSLLSDRPSSTDNGAERRAIETRAAELSMRAIAPGSALGCLDAVANADIETACEKAVFASPEVLAQAIAYIDAKLSLLASSAALAERDSSYHPPLDRMRRALEDDRFGVVAQVLTTRGCNPTRCADFTLLRNTARIQTNMQTRSFDLRVGLHAAAWNHGAASASPPQSVAAAPSLSGSSTPATLAPGGVAQGGIPPKFDFPSSASIPAVSIMNAEPVAEPQPERAAAPAKRPSAQQQQPARRSAPREAAAPPLSVLPPPPPAPPQQQAPAQTSGSR